jgi:hypothetical protein
MNLVLSGLENFSVGVIPVKAYRATIIVRELTLGGERTGREWAEPYDIRPKGEEKEKEMVLELAERFQRKIDEENTEGLPAREVLRALVPQVAIPEPEEDVPRFRDKAKRLFLRKK